MHLEYIQHIITFAVICRTHCHFPYGLYELHITVNFYIDMCLVERLHFNSCLPELYSTPLWLEKCLKRYTLQNH